MSTNEMSTAIYKLKELERLIEEAEAEVEAIKDMLKAHMTASNIEEMTVDVYKVRWTRVSSDKFDSTSFKKAMPDLAKQFTKTTSSRRFTIA